MVQVKHGNNSAVYDKHKEAAYSRLSAIKSAFLLDTVKVDSSAIFSNIFSFIIINGLYVLLGIIPSVIKAFPNILAVPFLPLSKLMFFISIMGFQAIICAILAFFFKENDSIPNNFSFFIGLLPLCVVHVPTYSIVIIATRLLGVSDFIFFSKFIAIIVYTMIFGYIYKNSLNATEKYNTVYSDNKSVLLGSILETIVAFSMVFILLTTFDI